MILGSTIGAMNTLDTEQVFAFLHKNGIKTVEIGTGGYVDATHIPAKTVSRSGNAVRTLKELLKTYELSISALSCCGNPIHPDRDKAAAHHQAFVDTCRLAHMLEVDTVVAFSGCPGDCAGSKHPNFVTTAFPEDFQEIVKWQWDRVLLPYWREAVSIAYSYGVRRIAIEMMPGFCVYNPQTLWKLRDEVGGVVGAAFDPAHLIRQGIDPVAAVRALKGIIYQVHAKDLLFNTAYRAENGVFANTAGDEQPFFARAVGNGHDAAYWQAIIDTLRDVGYDRSITIEHSDDHVCATEGIKLSAQILKKMI